MLKKTLTYEDPFSGEERTEDHYFHLSKAEIIELELSTDGGLEDMIKRIVAAKDGASIMREFKRIISLAWGEKVDGRFVKTPEKRDEFMAGEAYSALFVELVTNADAAAIFVNGVVGNKGNPAQTTLIAASEKVDTTPAEGPAVEGMNVREWEDARANWMLNNGGRDFPESLRTFKLSRADIVDLNDDEYRSGIATGKYVV